MTATGLKFGRVLEAGNEPMLIVSGTIPRYALPLVYLFIFAPTMIRFYTTPGLNRPPDYLVLAARQRHRASSKFSRLEDSEIKKVLGTLTVVI